MRFYRARPTGLMFLAPRSAFPLFPIAARASSPRPSMVRSAEGPTDEAQEEGNNSVKAQLRGAMRVGRGRESRLFRGAVRVGRGREFAPLGKVRVSGGGHARNWALFIISGSERGKSGKVTWAAAFANLALCWHAVRGDLPQGAGIASQGPLVDENRPISGRLGRSRRRPILASQRVSATDDLMVRDRSSVFPVVCFPQHPAAHRRGGAIRPASCRSRRA